MAEFKSNLKDRLNDFISFKRSIGKKYSLFSKHWLIRHRYRSGMRRMLDTDLLA